MHQQSTLSLQHISPSYSMEHLRHSFVLAAIRMCNLLQSPTTRRELKPDALPVNKLPGIVFVFLNYGPQCITSTALSVITYECILLVFTHMHANWFASTYVYCSSNVKLLYVCRVANRNKLHIYRSRIVDVSVSVT